MKLQVIYLAWSHDGTRLASASSDKTVVIWAGDQHKVCSLLGLRTGVCGSNLCVRWLGLG